MYNNIKSSLPDAELWIAQQFAPPTMTQFKKLLTLANKMVMEHNKHEIHFTFTVKNSGGADHNFRIDFTANGMKLRYGRSVQLDGVKDVDVILAEIDALIRLNVY
ncbi:MAG TPA: hypothetical protein PLI87_22475 [bacterium]|nr:hypothetical protein [bacterium]